MLKIVIIGLRLRSLNILNIKKIKLKTKKAFSVVVYEIKIIIIDKFALNCISFILSFNVE